MNLANNKENEPFILYRGLLRELVLAPLFAAEAEAEADADAAEFYAALSERAAALDWQGNIFLLSLVDALLTADNAFSRAAALAPEDSLPPALMRVAEAELARLQQLSRRPLPGPGAWQELAANFPRLSLKKSYSAIYERFLYQLADDFLTLSPAELCQCLAGFHQRYGCGPLVRHTFLTWQEGLTGVSNADCVLPQQLFAYEQQKQQVMQHVAAFVQGKPTGHLLLYGERGTGKSSLVKAAVNHYAASGLRLLYVPRAAWGQLAEILAALSAYRQRFVIFLDDFSFDTAQDDYKQIKSVIEGGAEALPDNVLLIATSNRRHLVAESWRDREDRAEDMYTADSESEKLALADRFALTVVLPPPGQQEYLQIVAGLANLSGLTLPQQELFAAAIRWERWHNTRSGRTARQFIDHLLCQ